MDGVIVDSNPLHRLAWEAFNRQFGLETTEEMHQRMYGKRNDQIVRDFFGDGLTQEEVSTRGASKESLYRDMAGDRLEEMLVPGIREFLEFYRDAAQSGRQQRGARKYRLLVGSSLSAPLFSSSCGRSSGAASQAAP